MPYNARAEATAPRPELCLMLLLATPLLPFTNPTALVPQASREMKSKGREKILHLARHRDLRQEVLFKAVEGVAGVSQAPLLTREHPQIVPTRGLRRLSQSCRRSWR